MKEAKKIFKAAREEGRTFVLEHEAKDIMKAYGIPIPAYATATTVEEAIEKSKSMGFPVVLKILSKDILHKSDAGGVKINLKNEDDVRKAFDEIMKNAKKYGKEKGLEIDLSRGVFISDFVDMGTEIIVGVTKDPQFGHALMAGLGGIFVEVLKDVSFRLIPFSETDAREMLSELKAYKILEGVRGEGPRDIDALVEVMLAVSKMVEENPEIIELDCNPTFVYEKGKGALVVDARILIENLNET
ncbi:MAG: acetyl-CoA synthetase [Candidatus Thorarchaeota archaeon SMTZ-45]|nr:MAG: acetyl-CoA synthetase [Candidatus Thorarchaeota archaeon SMTZ1-45]KXH75519.1 MAG: acetyl-CoA synthetase [Candidatus Thorarchaeota archaeon SMTZ-45]